MPDRRMLIGAALAASLAPRMAVAHGADQAARALYARFLAAQNARDLVGVRATLIEGRDFLWISDGKRFWGADALIARMGAFQKAEIWHVTPDLARARVVEVGPGSCFLYQPLALTLGNAREPRTIAFLVNVLCVETPHGWRIAALFTTEETP